MKVTEVLCGNIQTFYGNIQILSQENFKQVGTPRAIPHQLGRKVGLLFVGYFVKDHC